MFKIEKNIPIQSTAGRKKKYPFEKMEAGDSFFIKDDKSSISSVRQAVMRENRACLTHKWITRSIDGGVRVWCVEK